MAAGQQTKSNGWQGGLAGQVHADRRVAHRQAAHAAAAAMTSWSVAASSAGSTSTPTLPSHLTTADLEPASAFTRRTSATAAPPRTSAAPGGPRPRAGRRPRTRARYVVRGLLAWIEADDDGREMLAVRSVLRRNDVLLDYVRREAKRSARPQVAHVARYAVGVVLRVAELAGGTMRPVLRPDVEAAQAHVSACIEAETPHPFGLARTVTLQ